MIVARSTIDSLSASQVSSTTFPSEMYSSNQPIVILLLRQTSVQNERKNSKGCDHASPSASRGSAASKEDGKSQTSFQETRENAGAGIPGVFRIGELLVVVLDEVLVIWILLHVHETLDAFEDGRAEAIVVGHVGELGVVQLRHHGARLGRVVRLNAGNAIHQPSAFPRVFEQLLQKKRLDERESTCRCSERGGRQVGGGGRGSTAQKENGVIRRGCVHGSIG